MLVQTMTKKEGLQATHAHRNMCVEDPQHALGTLAETSGSAVTRTGETDTRVWAGGANGTGTALPESSSPPDSVSLP